ncbi:MAG: 4Fe-4S binding protein [Candidatus Saganbacteria bacterium]|nr:4Fe-4S binding protein [Candidatus Saganbacteria bacterium]
MTSKWYPIIDCDKCIGCLQCYDFCPHQVYDKSSDNKPKVMHPEYCVEFCKGCGKICDQKAITFFGDKK